MIQSLKTSLSHAVEKLLRPLIRILLRNGVAFGSFVEMARKVYVEVAWKEFGVEGRKQTVSRVSTITGLTRKDVAKLRGENVACLPPEECYNRAVRVLTGWISDPKYLDSQGKPISLNFENGESCFSHLVKRFSGDVPPRAVLDELLRVGAVRKNTQGKIELLQRGYIPQDDQEIITILGQESSDLISTIDHNLTCQPGKAFYQRSVSYDNLVTEALENIRKKAEQEGQNLLEVLNDLMSSSDRDADPNIQGSGRNRAVLGIYYYEENIEQETHEITPSDP